MHNYYLLAPGRKDIRQKMLSKYQVVIADLYSIHICNVKKLVPNFFDEEIYVIHSQKLELYLRLALKLEIYIVY